MAESAMLIHALRYARMGLSIIPVNGKVPCIKWKEFQERCASEEEIKAWWAEFPNADIGMVTGPITGRLVLDVDGPTGAESVKALLIPSTQTTKTRRGMQYHFTWPSGISAPTTVAAVLPGVDVRGIGGYVKLAPSSTTDGGRYAWLTRKGIGDVPLADTPQWLLDLLTKPKHDPLKPEQRGSSQVDQYMNGVGDGGRYHAFTVMAGFYFGNMRPDMAEKHLLEWNQKNKPPMEDIDQHIWRFRKKIEAGELSGYQEPVVEVVTDPDVAPFTVDIGKYLEELKHRGKYDEPEFVTGFVQLNHLCRGFARANLFVIGAPTGGGKTQLALAAILALIRKGKTVLYFSTEMPANEIRDRFNAIGADIPLDALRTGKMEEAHIQKLVAFLQTTDTSKFIIAKEDTPSLAVVRAAVEQVKPDILIIDHIHHIKMVRENRRTEMDDFIIGLKKLIIEQNIPCVVTAQLRRRLPNEYGVIEYSVNDFKESGGIENEAGVCLLICPPHKWSQERYQNVRMYIPKNRHGRKEVEFNLKFDTVTAAFREHQ